MAPKVSIIVPVYNTEPFLRECLDSLLRQSLKEIEIICVEDGSTDGSASVLSDYAARDARLVVHAQPNQGLSASRNVGVGLATGEYLHFLDSDDYLANDALETLHRATHGGTVDVVYFDAHPFFDSDLSDDDQEGRRRYYQRSREFGGPFSGPELFTQMVVDGDYRPSACLQLIRRDYYQEAGLAFIPGILHEDHPFTFRCALSARRVCHLHRPFYHRRIRESSITTTSKSYANFKGYLLGYAHMVAFALQGQYDAPTARAISTVCAGVYSQALKIYPSLTEPQRASIRDLDPGVSSQILCMQIMLHGQANLDLGHLGRKLAKIEHVRASGAYRFARLLGSFFRGAKTDPLP